MSPVVTGSVESSTSLLSASKCAFRWSPHPETLLIKLDDIFLRGCQKIQADSIEDSYFAFLSSLPFSLQNMHLCSCTETRSVMRDTEKDKLRQIRPCCARVISLVSYVPVIAWNLLKEITFLGWGRLATQKKKNQYIFFSLCLCSDIIVISLV